MPCPSHRVSSKITHPTLAPFHVYLLSAAKFENGGWRQRQRVGEARHQTVVARGHAKGKGAPLVAFASPFSFALWWMWSCATNQVGKLSSPSSFGWLLSAPAPPSLPPTHVRTPMYAQVSELTDHAKHREAGGGATHRAKNKKTSAERAAKQKEPEPDPAPEAPAVPRTAEEPNAKAIADAAAAAVKKAEEDAVCEAEKNTLAAAEKAARVLADPHKQRMGGDRRGAKNLRTDLSKGFGFGLASKLRSEGAPFDCFILCFSFGASSLRVFLGGWSALACSAVEVP